MNRTIPIIAAIAALHAGIATAATILYSPFDSLEGWSVRSVGATTAGIVDKTIDGKPSGATCAEVTSRRGSVFLTRELPLEDVLGCRITVSCLVKGDGVVRGPQISSTAKVHLAVETAGGIEHYVARFSGSTQWQRQGFTADVPPGAKRVVLNLGLEACFGRVLFDQLIVRNDKRGIHPLDLTPATNAGHDQLALKAFPEGELEWEGITFKILDAAKHDGSDCLRFRGIEHPDWPENTASPIPVNTCATAIYILHAALDGRQRSDTPCAIWNAWFADGPSYGLSLFEGRQIGAIGHAEDLENWKVAWQGESDSGETVTFGVTKWVIYSDSPVVSLTCQAYRGASPLVLAITAVEEPPAPIVEDEEYDEMGMPIGVGGYE